MSHKHPIIVATGSSGAGTSTVRRAFEHIFSGMGLDAAMIEGDSFHAYDRQGMREAVQNAAIRAENFSHFGPAANHFEKLEALFREYANTGSGQCRRYLHTIEEAEPFGQKAGTFTEWETLPENTDLLFYEGLHGAVETDQLNLGAYADLLVGIVPTINLEWTQKIWRDTVQRGYNSSEVQQNILRRMHDYVHYIMPQFSRTDVNFQRVPTVDTSNPFSSEQVPTPDESLVVVKFKDPDKWQVDFPYLLTMIHDSHMSRADTLVVPGSKMGMTIELIFNPIIEKILRRQSQES